jgi:hypothetical protein
LLFERPAAGSKVSRGVSLFCRLEALLLSNARRRRHRAERN